MRQLRAEPLPIFPLPCLKPPVAVRSDNRADQEVRIWGVNKKDLECCNLLTVEGRQILPAHSRELRHAIVVSSSASLPSVSPSCLARAMRLRRPVRDGKSRAHRAMSLQELKCLTTPLASIPRGCKTEPSRSAFFHKAQPSRYQRRRPRPALLKAVAIMMIRKYPNFG